MLGGYGVTRGQSNDEDEESDTSTEEQSTWGRFGLRTRRRARRRGPPEFEKVPSEEGTRLMEDGTFGTNERPEDSVRRTRDGQHEADEAGLHTSLESGHDHQLQRALLLWSVFKGRKLLLLLRARLSSEDVRYVQPV